MKTALVLLTLTFGANAFAHGLTPSEVYTIATLASTFAPTMVTADMSNGARKIIAHADEAAQNGELSVELQEMVRLVQAEDATLSEQDALDILVERAERILKADN